MSRRIVRLRQARRDLVEVAAYLEERNPDAALRFLAAVEATLAAVATTPGMGAKRSFAPPRLAGLHMLPVRAFEKYLVFDREADAAIELVRVLHGARDLATVLGLPD